MYASQPECYTSRVIAWVTWSSSSLLGRTLGSKTQKNGRLRPFSFCSSEIALEPAEGSARPLDLQPVTRGPSHVDAARALCNEALELPR